MWRFVGSRTRLCLHDQMLESLRVAHAVTPNGVIENAEIRISDGLIVEVSAQEPSDSELWAVPGFVDTHCHGALGVGFGDPDLADNLRAISYHRSQGSTTLVASTVTQPISRLVDQITVLRQLVDADELAGIHLEGPFLAAEKRGAHDPELLRSPAPELVGELLVAGGSALQMVTIAPELANGENAIKAFVDSEVVMAFGHSAAEAKLVGRALDWGITVTTHLFNAMHPIHHREPGPVPILLNDQRCLNELICDGFHLAPEVVRLAIDAAGSDRIALVTDAMSATGQPDGRYKIGDLNVQVLDGAPRLISPEGELGAIAGSTLTMAKAFKFVVEQVGCSIEQAAAMAATNPARWHGFDTVGALTPGRKADICLVTKEGDLISVIRGGELIASY